MHFWDTSISDTGLSTKRKTKIPLFLVDKDLKWAKEQAKKNSENVSKKYHQVSKIKGIEWLA